MNPEQIAKTSEHSHQAAFFCWCQQNKECYPLQFAFAIPNGGERNKREASRLKVEGVRKGVPDVFLPYPIKLTTSEARAGLWLEFKKPGTEKLKTGGASPEQKRYQEYLLSCGYEHKLVYSWLQAVTETIDYISRGNV